MHISLDGVLSATRIAAWAGRPQHQF